MVDRKKPRSHHFSAAVVAAAYAVIAVAWIFLSEYLLVIMVKQPINVVEYQSLKDWGFVLVTTLMLYVLVLFQLRKYSHHLQKYKIQRGEMRLLSQFRKSIIDNASIWINVLDKRGSVSVWNKAAEQISGYRREEVLKNEAIWEWLYPDPDYRESVRKVAQNIINLGDEVEEFETSIRTKSGQEKVIAWNSRRFLNEDNRVMGSISIGRDITEHKRAVQALREREVQLATLMGNLPGMAYRCLIDDFWTMKFVSSGCKQLTGYESDMLTDNQVIAFASIIHEEDRAIVELEVSQALRQDRSFAVEYRIRRRDDTIIWVWEQGQAVSVGRERFLEGIILDIDQRKMMEQELEQLATHDPLTGLYNRRELEQQLRDELMRASRYERPLSLLWIDVDHFKRINDDHGHLAGDEVLRQLSQLLQSNVRAIDYVARYGGEELIIVMPEAEEREAMEMAERLRSLVEATRIGLSSGLETGVTLSIGVAAFPRDGQVIDQLFKRADEAMYQAKQQGRNRTIIAAEIE